MNVIKRALATAVLPPGRYSNADPVSKARSNFAVELLMLIATPPVDAAWEIHKAAKPRDPAYGIIDPDYARVFTIARCIAWSEGYAIAMHGSFTRDLDLIAIPWDEKATDAEHLVRRIALALDDLSILVKKPDAASQASPKPHGRLAWTLTFKAFGDPRFVDLSVMPRATPQADLPELADANQKESITP